MNEAEMARLIQQNKYIDDKADARMLERNRRLCQRLRWLALGVNIKRKNAELGGNDSADGCRMKRPGNSEVVRG